MFGRHSSDERLLTSQALTRAHRLNAVRECASEGKQRSGIWIVDQVLAGGLGVPSSPETML